MNTEYLTKEKSQCKVEVIQYTKSPYNDTAIATLRCTYPRYIHSEVMTHRMFSRNSASSRATPTKVLLERIRSNPAFFTQLGINQSGMNASQVLDEKQAEEFKSEWLEMANLVADKVEDWTKKYNLHKQVVNRILEPFMMTTTIITATEWDNFFMTRYAEGVEPTMHDLAECMLDALTTAKVLCETQNQEYSNIVGRHIHLPFVDVQELQSRTVQECIMQSVARCARCTIMSNVTKEKSTLEEDSKLFNRLITAKPTMHASPFEHQAVATKSREAYFNLRGGWMSYRYFLENQTDFMIFSSNSL